VKRDSESYEEEFKLQVKLEPLVCRSCASQHRGKVNATNGNDIVHLDMAILDISLPDRFSTSCLLGTAATNRRSCTVTT
jgi:hypothetical protein